MGILKKFKKLLKIDSESVPDEKSNVKSKIEFKITKEFMSLNEEERRKYLANAFSIDYCLKLGLASFKIIPHKKYFQPVNELISFKDKEEMDKFLNLV